ncbi:hypothetical protein BJ508DRAFT_334504 [Ascobolus immersus RN42]|uniref:Uncharacterized protein n=1 Tax=Ascobolus immersus RN42 TaxID=1160509 RepID=A0A3N4HKD5_ASCIM|nr:hypothetical protein BJ508DRAFT_334504 [Ascobolus immersus RN42]
MTTPVSATAPALATNQASSATQPIILNFMLNWLNGNEDETEEEELQDRGSEEDGEVLKRKVDREAGGSNSTVQTVIRRIEPNRMNGTDSTEEIIANLRSGTSRASNHKDTRFGQSGSV